MLTIEDVKNRAKFICEHIDPSGKPINCFYNEDTDIYYITYDAEVTRDKEEYTVSKKGCDIKNDILFDPFSELKMIVNMR